MDSGVDVKGFRRVQIACRDSVPIAEARLAVFGDGQT